MASESLGGDERQQLFVSWCESNGSSESYIKQMTGILSGSHQRFGSMSEYLPGFTSAFDCASIEDVELAYETATLSPANEASHNQLSSVFKKYRDFLVALDAEKLHLYSLRSTANLRPDQSLSSDGFDSPTQRIVIHEPRNLIYFGAPGTGKSYQLNQKAKCNFDEANITRVTFHPDYTYAQFVGCLKPFSMPVIDTDDPPARIEDASTTIEYEFAVGPFIEVYVKAIKHPDQNFLLVVEEINRANPAAVFGDVFQLLDRDESGVSEYPVATSKDLRWPLFKVWKSILNAEDPDRANMYSLDDPEASEKASTLVLPENMYIWATMNSADQGVFPMDTAFKRRWDFRYMDINDEVAVAEISSYDVPLGDTGERVKWNDLRAGINNVLRNANINEDKWLGPFFVKPAVLADDIAFANAFKDKVLLYLYEDAAKSKPGKVFADRNLTYSEICKKFSTDGVDVFCDFGEINVVASPGDVDGDEGNSIEEA